MMMWRSFRISEESMYQMKCGEGISTCGEENGR